MRHLLALAAILFAMGIVVCENNGGTTGDLVVIGEAAFKLRNDPVANKMLGAEANSGRVSAKFRGAEGQGASGTMTLT